MAEFRLILLLFSALLLATPNVCAKKFAKGNLIHYLVKRQDVFVGGDPLTWGPANSPPGADPRTWGPGNYPGADPRSWGPGNSPTGGK
ncbi:hypothetical protein OESDEN_16760 [Oesophagostomum dentatum]|uniref:Uncharacterized protein n=1 Tax=Oesophagostomum dentatum TaxID=61180 RepID=A0A0B1SI17_OESDE|nr:hypothetical protein OESDEN_16760 [Oesophagostomum dentatum]